MRQVDAKGQVTRHFYDSLGRPVERREHPGSEATIPFGKEVGSDSAEFFRFPGDAVLLPVR